MYLTFIIGLPGSGKTHLAQEIAERTGGIVVDDISVDADSKIETQGHHLIVTDPNACASNPDLVMGMLRKWFGERIVECIAFENDPDQCWANIEGRDNRVISRATIDGLSRRYDPYAWGRVVPVWR